MQCKHRLCNYTRLIYTVLYYPSIFVSEGLWSISGCLQYRFGHIAKSNLFCKIQEDMWPKPTFAQMCVYYDIAPWIWTSDLIVLAQFLTFLWPLYFVLSLKFFFFFSICYYTSYCDLLEISKFSQQLWHLANWKQRNFFFFLSIECIISKRVHFLSRNISVEEIKKKKKKSIIMIRWITAAPASALILFDFILQYIYSLIMLVIAYFPHNI